MRIQYEDVVFGEPWELKAPGLDLVLLMGSARGVSITRVLDITKRQWDRYEIDVEEAVRQLRGQVLAALRAFVVRY